MFYFLGRCNKLCVAVELTFHCASPVPCYKAQQFLGAGQHMLEQDLLALLCNVHSAVRGKRAECLNRIMVRVRGPG